jgi:hypothetical protein
MCSTDQNQVPLSKHFNSGKTGSCVGKDPVKTGHIQVVFVFTLKTGSPKLLCILLRCPTEKSNHALTNPVPFSDTFCYPVKPKHKIPGLLADWVVHIQPRSFLCH